MTESALQKALADSISETLDAMFFTSCLEAAGARPGHELELAARVGFEGRQPGSLTVRMAAGAARAIAAAFLGEDEAAVSERQIADVLCELTNMICGFVLSRVECAEEFRLGEPRLAPAGALEAPDTAGRTVAAYAVETGAGALEAVLEMEGRICPP
jgi:CheY-specific phosphatase CheX